MTARAARIWTERLLDQLGERTDRGPFYRQLQEAAAAASRSPDEHRARLRKLLFWGKLEGFGIPWMSDATGWYSDAPGRLSRFQVVAMIREHEQEGRRDHP